VIGSQTMAADCRGKPARPTILASLRAAVFKSTSRLTELDEEKSTQIVYHFFLSFDNSYHIFNDCIQHVTRCVSQKTFQHIGLGDPRKTSFICKRLSVAIELFLFRKFI